MMMMMMATTTMCMKCLWSVFKNVFANSGLNGVFVTGWCKRGPKGDIGSNLSDAAETGASVMAWQQQLQLQQQQQKAGFAGLRAHLTQRNVQWVGKEGWERIDAHERRKGAEQVGVSSISNFKTINH